MPFHASDFFWLTYPDLHHGLLGILSEHMGPHSIRHACATQLLKRGTPLKDIADFLGHSNLKCVSIYAKHDVRSLRQVSAFSLRGVQ
jgi:integrase/recombinase XerD